MKRKVELTSNHALLPSPVPLHPVSSTCPPCFHPSTTHKFHLLYLLPYLVPPAFHFFSNDSHCHLPYLPNWAWVNSTYQPWRVIIRNIKTTCLITISPVFMFMLPWHLLPLFLLFGCFHSSTTWIHLPIILLPSLVCPSPNGPNLTPSPPLFTLAILFLHSQS